jgi:hypothetical protein
VTKTRSRCSSPQSWTKDQLGFSRNKRKLRRQAFRNLYRSKLRRPPSTSGLPGEVLSGKPRKSGPQRINFRRFCDRTSKSRPAFTGPAPPPLCWPSRKPARSLTAPRDGALAMNRLTKPEHCAPIVRAPPANPQSVYISPYRHRDNEGRSCTN